MLRSFINIQTSGTSSGNKWQRVTTSATTSDNEWQRVTANDNKWHSEWQRVLQRVTMSDNKWQQVTILPNFSFFQIRAEPTIKHPNDNSLNLEEDLWRATIELRAETSP